MRYDLINQLPGIIYLYNLESRKMLYCNEALQRILGYSLKELNEIKDEDIIFADDQNVYQQMINCIISQREDVPVHSEYRVITKDGRIRWLSDQIVPVERGDQGFPKLVLGIATDTTTKHQEQEQFLEEIRFALSNDQIKLYTQPIVDLTTEQPIGVEILARWHHNKRGILLPGAFLPQLEQEPGLMTRFCIYVLSRSCECLETMPGLFVSVNVSPLTLDKEGFLAFIQSILLDVKTNPGQFFLEITETMSIRDYDYLDNLINNLKQIGVGVILDDFGTGHNSLRNLMKFRAIAKLKIDREFISQIETPDGYAIIEAIVSLAHHLGIQTVAEGIETATQVQFLRKIGCQLGQGYFFGRPTQKS